MANTDNPVYGKQDIASGNSDFNQMSFFMKMMLSKVHTSTLVKVISSTSSGTSPVGTVTILPLVNQVDGAGNSVSHGKIYNVPYFRYQGGDNAVIIDPKAGDIGFCMFAEKDISSVKVSGSQSMPASSRTFDYSDALYIGGYNFTIAPTNYIQISDSGINVISPNPIAITTSSTCNVTASTVTVTAPTTNVTGNLIVAGTIAVNGSGTSTMSGSLTTTGQITSGTITLTTHTHTGVTTGSGSTGGPQG
jgi:hypothetical protein